MKTASTDRHEIAARELFDIHAQLERARIDLETANWRYELARGAAQQAKERLELSETPLAQMESCEANQRMRQLEQVRDSAQAVVGELERVKDGLLSKLVT